MSQTRERNKLKSFIDIHNMCPIVTGFMNYGQQTIGVLRYIVLNQNRVKPLIDQEEEKRSLE